MIRNSQRFLAGALSMVFVAAGSVALAHPHPDEDGKVRPPISVRGQFMYNEPADFEETDGEVGVKEWRIDAPIFGKEIGEFRFIGMARYRFTELDFGEDGAEPLEDLELHGLKLRFDTLWRPEGRNWYLWTRVSPEAFGDRDSLGDGFGVSGIFSYGYDFTENFSLALGGYYGRSFGGYTFLPSIGIIWTINPEWNLRLVPPNLTLTYHPTDSFKAKLSAFPGGGSWSINEETNGGVDTVDFGDVRVALGVEQRISHGWWVTGWAGMNFLQSLELESDAGETVFDEDIAESLFLSIGARYEF